MTAVITRYTVHPDCWDRLGSIARTLFRIEVTLADPDTDRWAITRAGQRLSRANQWHYEPAPSGRTQGWAKAHQFELHDAIRRAEILVNLMVVAGETADQCAEREDQQRAQTLGGEGDRMARSNP